MCKWRHCMPSALRRYKYRVPGGKSHADCRAPEKHDELMTLGLFLSAVFMVQMGCDMADRRQSVSIVSNFDSVLCSNSTWPAS